MKGIAKVINELREAQGLSKGELARLSGLDRVTIYRIEQTGKAELKTLEKIANALMVDVNYLVTPPELRTVKSSNSPHTEAVKHSKSTASVTLPLDEYNQLIAELAILREKSKKER